MAYTKTNWADLPSTSTPINATNLNKIEQGIYDTDVLANNLIYCLPFKVIFNVANATAGDFVTAATTNEAPTIQGMTIVGFIPKVTGYGNVNFVLSPNSRGNKINATLKLAYKGSSDTTIELTGYALYVNSNFFGSTTIT